MAIILWWNLICYCMYILSFLDIDLTCISNQLKITILKSIVRLLKPRWRGMVLTFIITSFICGMDALISQYQYCNVASVRKIHWNKYLQIRIIDSTFWEHVSIVRDDSLRHNDQYMHLWTGSPLVQGKTCRLFGANQLPRPLFNFHTWGRMVFSSG